MLLYTEMVLEDITIKVPLVAEIHSQVGSKNIVGFKQMLGSKEIVERLHNEGNEVYFAAMSNRVLPVLQNEVGIDLSALYGIYLSMRTSPDLFTEAMYQDFAGQLAAYNITAELVEKFLYASKDVYEYLEEPTFKLNINKMYCSDVNTVTRVMDTINNSLGGGEVISAAINVTSFMKTPEDKVFIMLPGMDDIKLESYILPEKDEVMVDYPVKQYNEDNYLKFLRSEADLPMIVGNSENNNLPIQENEKEFYDALCALIKYGVEKDYPDMTLEQCEEAGISSKLVKDYLKELALTVGRFNWNHTGAYPELYEDVDEDGDVEISEKRYGANAENFLDFRDAGLLLSSFIDRVSSKNIYAPAEVIIKLLRWGDRKPTTIRVEDFPDEYILNTQMTKAIRLGISDCELALNDGAEYTLVAPLGVNGTFGDMTYLRDLGVHLNVLQYPIGVICHRYFLSKSEDNNGRKTQIHQTVAMTWIDVIEILKENPNNIKGISFNNGQYQIDPLDPELSQSEAQLLPNAVNMIHTYGSNSEFIAYTSKRVIALTKALNENFKGYSYLECLNKYMFTKNIVNSLGTFAVTSRAEVEELVIEGYAVPEILSGRIAGAILPSVVKSLAKLQDIVMTGELTFTKALNTFAVTEEDEPVDLELEDVEETKAMSSSINSVADKLTKLAFNEEKETPHKPETQQAPVEPVKEQPPIQESPTPTTNEIGKPYQNTGEPYVNGFMYSDIRDGESLRPLVAGPDFKVVGYLALRKEHINGKEGKVYVFAPTTVENGVKLDKAQNSFLVTALLKVMLNDFYRISCGAGTPVCRFTDRKTMLYFIKLLTSGTLELKEV